MSGTDKPVFMVYAGHNIDRTARSQPRRMVVDAASFIAANADALSADEYEALCNLLVAAQHGYARADHCANIGGGAGAAFTVYVEGVQP